MKRRFLMMLIFMLVGIPSAFASHYDLEDVDLFPEEVATRLTADNVKNTEDLFALLVTKAGREAFVKKYGVSQEEVDFVAHELELMQIKGIGPKAATLLLKSGIQDVTSLAQASPNELLENLLRTNRELNITGVQPDITVTQDWIEKAKKIANRIQ